MALLTLVPATAADASFPGRNGQFAVVVEGCQNQTYVRAYSTAGRDLGTPVPCAAGGEEDEPGEDVFAPEWAPGGARLAFTEGEGQLQEYFTVAADGSDRRHVPIPHEGRFGERGGVSFSPDGERVAFVRAGSIYTARVDGSDVRLLRAQRLCGGGGICVHYREPRWSPDGRTIAFVAGSARPKLIKNGLWLMRAGSGELVRRLSGRGSEADWSPDSRRLVFRTPYQQREIRGGASGGNVFVVRADGRGRPRRIVHRENVAEIQPTWAPDGRSIAWISLGFSAGDVSFRVRPSLWRMRLRGGEPRRIRKLPAPYVEEGFWDQPDLAWQSLPR